MNRADGARPQRRLHSLVKAAVSPVKGAPDASLKCSMCTELAATRFELGRAAERDTWPRPVPRQRLAPSS